MISGYFVTGFVENIEHHLFDLPISPSARTLRITAV